jgi:hypothetical protein
MNAISNHSRVLTSLLLVALVAAACGSTSAVAGPAGAQAPTPTIQLPEVASPEPSLAPAPPASPSPAPTATPGPSSPTKGAGAPDRPAPPVPTVWSKASVALSGQCWSPAATVDQQGAYHVVATCGTRVRYATSKDGRRWRAGTFSRPARHHDVSPQIAVDGSVLYVAFNRLRETDGGCGDDGLEDVGVYYRSRKLPSGPWSGAVRIGAAGDHLQSFRVDDGVIHETYASGDGQMSVSYASVADGKFRSVRIPGAVQTSLRIGDDGRARIAYTTGDSINYAIVGRDSGLSTRTVFKSRDMQLTSPSLVLGVGNRAYLAWSAHEMWGGGCADGAEPVSKPGTYFGTDASGTWQVRRISKVVADPSLTLDLDRGRASVVIGTSSGAREMTRLANGTWSGTRIPRTRSVDQLVVRRDQVTGHLLLVGLKWSEDSEKIEIVAFVKS